ncbi:MAG: SGNH/GDSL hydrolase family protein [Ferruginibacter sp.]|nr:SGNH/GDSL hydrolase family protein [Ferruginibacter sp.]
MKTYSYLALGDSYTIGEQVNLLQSFPYQTVQLLRAAGLNFYAPEIIASTGWTTEELKLAIDESLLQAEYDFISVLIGVNNQYQGRSVDEFRVHFRVILELAIQQAGGVAKNVIVLSIPDWGVTPFAINKSPEKVRSEIDMYNFICQAEAEHFQTRFIDITQSQRLDGNREAFLAPDLLHPSQKEYAKWAEQIAALVMVSLNG